MCVLAIASNQLYHQSVVLTLQQLVDSWIVEREGSTVDPPVVRVTEFPSPSYEDDGFWAQVRMIRYDMIRYFEV